jgi:pyruvate dehydrogenase E2 component (dihydrolipoamide acetyltransferase)
MEEVIMPKMGLSMEVGKIEEWRKKEGDKVTSGEILFVLSTEKISIEIEAFESGYLRKILAKEGSEVPVTEVIAYIGELDEEIPGEASISKSAENGSVKEFLTDTKENTYSSDIDASSVLMEERGPGIKEIKLKKSIPIKGIRKVISEKMTYSIQNIPHIMQTIVINADNLIDFREKTNKKAESEYSIHITYTDLLIKAAGIVLAEQPIINSSLQQENHLIYDEINVAIGISTDAGLMVATIFDADKANIFDIARKRLEYVEKAKQGLLKIEEISNATFTISNLGMFGIRNFTAIINPPQAAILMVGEIYKSAVEEEGKAVFKKFMNVSIAVDHRIIDGADSVKYLQRLKEVIEGPEILLK